MIQNAILTTEDCIESEYFPTIINILGEIVSNIVWNCLSSVLRREKRRIKPAIRIKWSERDSFMREESEGQINTAVILNGGLHCRGLRAHTFLTWTYNINHSPSTYHISLVWHTLKEAFSIWFCFITNHLECSTLMAIHFYYFDFLFKILCGIKHLKAYFSQS